MCQVQRRCHVPQGWLNALLLAYPRRMDADVNAVKAEATRRLKGETEEVTHKKTRAGAAKVRPGCPPGDPPPPPSLFYYLSTC